MKTLHTTAVVLFVSSALLAVHPLRAESTAAAPSASGEKPACPWTGKGGKFFEKNLANLHTALKLTPDQEAAWKTWSEQIKAGKEERKERREEFANWQNLPAIERMEKALEFSKARQAHLEAAIAATKTFYATLTPEQKPVFDQQFRFWPHHWKGGMEPGEAPAEGMK